MVFLFAMVLFVMLLVMLASLSSLLVLLLRAQLRHRHTRDCAAIHKSQVIGVHTLAIILAVVLPVAFRWWWTLQQKPTIAALLHWELHDVAMMASVTGLRTLRSNAWAGAQAHVVTVGILA